MATTSSTPTPFSVDAERLGELGAVFRGALVTPTDPGYDDLRRLDNAAIDRRPALIIRCTGPADVVDGVNLARTTGAPLAIRSGGHHVGGHGSVDDGIVLDLRDMKGVWVDPANLTVRVQGGATWGQVDRETQAFGLAVPGGIVSTTGVGGLTLGGGVGWLVRKWGLSCDSLLSARIVLASGEVVTASATEHADLFWAIRGGGGNFGVAVDLTFRAHPLGPEIAAAFVLHPLAGSEGVLRGWRDLAVDAPDEVTSRAMLWTMADDDTAPPPARGRDVLIIGAVYAGDASRGREALAPYRALGEPLVDMSDMLGDYRFLQYALDGDDTPVHSYWKSLYLDRLDDEALSFVYARALERPDPRILVHLPAMGGACGRVGAADTAFGDRSAPFMLSVDGMTEDAARLPEVRAWVRATVEAARGLDGAGGTYLNFVGDDASDRQVVDQQYGANLGRLREVKRTYDPDNLFRINNNILPA
ncbi:FAD-binding oxidoreductase [Demequina sp. SYSU T00192]|uniref:FAD-binding oxidoreductase n=1 Tax=Demequina litoralis TaxID=3051660 RepID=A0ABT8G5G0_9MICO|nr:FAD-binding oxidoreductase [Demequina sp. SYSU T00192]MDN4474362.1 FAD-binding oxidoreductase [Demequina sp. SYSU T00192]